MGRKEKSKKNPRILVLTFVCSFCILLVALTNINFAQEEIEATDTGEKVNQEIEKRVNVLMEESRQILVDFTKQLAKTRHGIVRWRPLQLNIHYEVKSYTEERASFVIYKREEFNFPKEERYYYNINLQTGKEITLKDVLGENFQEIATTQIQKQMEERMKEDPDSTFYKEEEEALLEHGYSFKTVEEEQVFYRNAKGETVVVFPEDSIAPRIYGNFGICNNEIKIKVGMK